MLDATRRLLAESGPRDWRVGSALVRAIMIDGKRADAEALLPLLLDDPEERGGLVEPLVHLGDAAMFRALADRFIQSGRLAPDAPPALLWGLGWHGVAEATPLLLHHVYEREGVLGTAEAEPAMLGLLHLPLGPWQSEIRERIAACLDRPSFPEHLPALAARLGDRPLVEALVEHGRTRASPSFLAGIVMAVGLGGPAARDRLADLIWHPSFRLGDGIERHLARAMRLTGLDVAGLCARLRARCAAAPPGADPRGDFLLLQFLVDHVVADWRRPFPLRFAPPARESAADMMHALFAWSNPHCDDSMIGLARDTLGEGGGDREWVLGLLYELERRLQLRVDEEALHPPR